MELLAGIWLLKVYGDPLLTRARWGGAKCNMLVEPKGKTDQTKVSQHDCQTVNSTSNILEMEIS